MLFILVSPASAHVVVKPNTASVGAFQTFTIGVPNEKDNPTVGLKLVLPEGVKHVSPNVKPGWTIEVKKSGEGEDASVTEIIWSGGSIPVGQRDEFLFSAQTPAQETALTWKAYQTYENGETVAWDQEPGAEKHDDESSSSGPYSQTKIVNDLGGQTTAAQESPVALYVSVAALILAGVALSLQFWKKK